MESLSSDPKIAFRQVADKIRSHGISTQTLSSLKSIQILLRFHQRSSSSRSWRQTSNRSRLIAALLACLAAVFIAAVVRWELYSNRGFATAWLTWKNLDVYGEQVLNTIFHVGNRNSNSSHICLLLQHFLNLN